MANTIKIKSSGTLGNVPGALANGELAINFADGDLFYKDSSGVVKVFKTIPMIMSDTPPSNPRTGFLWYETDTGRTFVYYDSFWVEVGSDGGAVQGIPTGGTPGQILSKNSATNYDTTWINGGLKLIKTVAIGNAVSTVVVNDAFNSSHNNYRVVINDPVGSILYQTTLNIQFGSASTGHYGGFLWSAYGAGSNYVYTSGNGSNAPLFQAYSGTGTTVTFDITSPYAAQGTSWSGTSANGSRILLIGGNQLSNTSFTSFTLTTSSGTITGGTIRVYGYIQ